MICRCNDVVVIPFPFTERRVVKPRPALVLSGEEFNSTHGQVVVAMITTAARSAWPNDVAIGDLPSAGLRHPSVVRWKVFTIPGEAIGPRIGSLAEADAERVAIGLRSVLGANERR